MSLKPWLNRLLKVVSKPSRTAPRKRPAISPVRMEFLEDRTAPATLTWTGAAGASWSDAGNWTGGGVPSAINNVLNFTASANVSNYTSTNDIPSLTGITINITDADAAGDFTIAGLNVGVTSVTHNKTDNQPTATTLDLAMTGVGATVTDTAGALSILNTANVFDAASTVNVPTGASLTVAVFPSSSLGNAKYNLTGGTLNVAPAGAFYTNAFNVGQNATPNNVAANGVPLASLGTDVQPYPMMADISRGTAAGDTFQTNTRTWGENKTYFYSGEIFFPDTNGDGTGSIAFAAAIDDSSALYIDGTQYYSFTNNQNAFSLDPNTGLSTVTLPTGWHTFDLRLGNGTGGAGTNNNTANGATGWLPTNNPANPTGKGFGYRVTDSFGSETSANPRDAKLYRRLYAAPNIYGINAITQSGNTVTVTTAAVGTNATMNSSVKVGDRVSIAGVTPIQYNGFWTVAAVSGNTFTFAHPQSGLPAGAVNPNTTLTLPDDGAQRVRYGINNIVQSGTTTTVTTAAPGTTTAMPAGVQVGDEIVISGATPTGYNGTWTVTAVTANNTFQFEHTASGVGTFTASAANTTVGLPDEKVRVRIPATINGIASNAVNVSGNSTIVLDSSLVSATMGVLTMASGANLSVVAGNTAGQTLNFGGGSLGGNVTFSPDTGATVNVLGVISETAAAGITKAGAGTLALSANNTYTGATTINAGTVIANANGALGTVGSGTTVASGGRLVIGAVTYSNAEPVSITGTGTTAINGALSSAGSAATFAGPVTLAGNAWITSAGNTLTLNGGITMGANQLTFGGTGTVAVAAPGITGTGTLAKAGSGTTLLSVANPNFSGNINVIGGTLTGAVSGSFGAGPAPIAVKIGGALGLAGGATYDIAKPLSIAGNGPDGNGALTNIAGTTTATFTSVTLAEAAAVGARAGNFTLTNDFIVSSTAANLTFAGAGNVNAPGKITDPSAGAGFYYVGFSGATGGETAQQRILNWTYTGATNIDFGAGFGASAPALNGSASIQGSELQLTSQVTNQAGSAYVTALAGNFNTSFQFQFKSTATSAADGFAFVIQNTGLTALGTVGGGLGYGGIGNSIAVQINMYNDVTNFGVGRNGAITHTNDLTAFGLDFHARDDNGFTDVFQADISFVAATSDLKVTFRNVTQNSTPEAFDFPSFTIPSTTATVLSVTKTGGGIATLGGANTYTGTTTINAGTLVATSDQSLGTGNARITAQSGGALGLSGPTFNFTKPLTISGAGVNGALKILSGTTTATFAGPITVPANASIGADAGTLTVTNDFATAAAVTTLTLTGAGNVVLTGNIGSAPPATQPAYQYVGFTGATGGENAVQNILNWTFTGAGPNGTKFDFSDAKDGFNNTGPDAAPLNFNGGASVIPDPNDPTGAKGVLSLTEAVSNQTRSVFTQVEPGAFTSSFQFQFQRVNSYADGFTFTIHNAPAGVSALGGGGGNLGYQGIPQSLSAQFNMYQNVSQFGFGVNGALNKAQFPALAPFGIDFQKRDANGYTDVFQVDINYSAAGALAVTMKNVTTNSNPVTFLSTGTVAIVKTGAGSATLAGTNTYAGTTSVNAGTLIVPSAAAIGSTPFISVASGATLGLQSGVTLNTPINLAGAGAGGVGALNNISGVNSVTGPISIAAGATIGSAAGTLNVDGTIALGNFANLAFTGAGNTVVSKPFGNGNTGAVTVTAPNALLQQWYNLAGVAGDENFINSMGTGANGGFVARTPILGSNLLDANSPNGGVLAFPNLASFNDNTQTPVTGVPATAGDNFGFMWTGLFKAPKAGSYQFGVGQTLPTTGVDDEMSIYIDFNDNGILENATERVATTVGVGCCGNGSSAAARTFAAGETHRIVIAFHEFGGGERTSAVFRIVGDPAFNAFTAINPGDPSQAGMWSATNSILDQKIVTNHVSVSGPGTVTFAASNTYNGNTTVTGGTLATTANNSLGVNPDSTLTVSGATAAVNLFNSPTAVTTVGNANFSAGTGTVNTGAAGGKLAIKSKLTLAGGHVVTGDMTAQGANLADNAAPRTLAAVSGTLDVARFTASPIAIPDKGSLVITAVNQNNSVNYTADPSAKVLVVSIGNRSTTADTVPTTITYGGQPLTSAVNVLATTSTYTNAYIYYLMNPPVGQSLPLVVNWNVATSVLSTDTVEVFTLSGVDTTATPSVGSQYITNSAASITLSANVPVAGSAAVTLFNYRKGSATTATQTFTNNGAAVTGVTGGINQQASGTPTTTTAASGNLWMREDTNLVVGGGLLPNLAAGTLQMVATAPQQSGSFFSGAIAVFAPQRVPIAIDLSATNFDLPANTKLSVTGAGDSVIGSVNATGDAQIIPGAGAPATLTLGGVGGPGVGTLNSTANLGLKLGTGSTFRVDLNGATANLNDQVNVNGVVTLTGATLNVTTGPGFTPAVGSTYTIINNDGTTDAVVGTFAGLPQGATVVGGTGTYTISYTGGDGNDVVLTAATPGAATTTTLVAAPLATTGGSLVQFTATVVPSPGALGTVTFLDNGVAITGGANIALVDGVAVFSTTTLAIGTHPVTAAYSGAAGFASSTSNVQNVVISSAGGNAPTVSTVTFNGGLAGFTAGQRSRMVNATVEFDQPVTLDLGAMTLVLHTGNVNYAGNATGTGQPLSAAIPATFTATASTDSKTWTLTWSGDNTDVGADQLASLRDGVYNLVIDATKVHPAGSPTVNMAANHTTVFHRLFGDSNPAGQTGNEFSAIVATVDNLAFRNAFNKPVGGGYVPFLDVNGDGSIGTIDNLQFRSRFNKNLTWTV